MKKVIASILLALVCSPSPLKSIETNVMKSDSPSDAHHHDQGVPTFLKNIKFEVSLGKEHLLVRPMSISDIETVIKMNKLEDNPVMRDTFKSLIEMTNPPEINYLILKKSGTKDEAVGTFTFIEGAIFYNTIDFSITIDPQYHGQGLGTQVVANILKMAKVNKNKNPGESVVLYIAAQFTQHSKAELPKNSYLKKAGMIPLDDDPRVYYWPLMDHLPTPTKLPNQ